MEDILRELNLSPDLLDDALIQLRRKQALKGQQKPNRLIDIGVVATLVVVIGLWFFSSQQHNAAIAKVQAQEDRITLGQDKGSDFKAIKRQIIRKFISCTVSEAPRLFRRGAWDVSAAWRNAICREEKATPWEC